MTFPAWALNFFTIAAVSAVLGVGIAASAPSSGSKNHVAQEVIQDVNFHPGQDGIDHAAITGPRAPMKGKIPACADPDRRGNLRPCVLPG